MAIPPEESASKTDNSVNYKTMYKNLKKKFFILLQENECFQSELRKSQGEFLQVTRDNDFLLERLMQYENFEGASTDSDATDSSDDESHTASTTVKSETSSRKRKAAVDTTDKVSGSAPPKKKRATNKGQQAQQKTIEITIPTTSSLSIKTTPVKNEAPGHSSKASSPSKVSNHQTSHDTVHMP